MKKFFKSVLVVCAVAFAAMVSASCSKDEVAEKKLVGKWQSTSIYLAEYDEAGNMISEETKYYTDDWCSILDLKADGTGTLIDYEDGETMTVNLTWVVANNKITMIVEGLGGLSLTFDIESVTAKEAVLYAEEVHSDGSKDIDRTYFKKL